MKVFRSLYIRTAFLFAMMLVGGLFCSPKVEALSSYQFATETLYSDGYDYSKEESGWASYDGTEESMQITPLQINGAEIEAFDLVIDQNNAAHVLVGVKNVGLQYITNESGSWVYTTLKSTTNTSTLGLDAEMDKDGTLHVLWSDSSGGLYYLAKIKGAWSQWRLSTVALDKVDFYIDSQGYLNLAGSQLANLYYGHFYGAQIMLSHPMFIYPPAQTALSLVESNGTYFNLALRPDGAVPSLVTDDSTGTYVLQLDSSTRTWKKTLVWKAAYPYGNGLLNSEVDLNGVQQFFIEHSGKVYVYSVQNGKVAAVPLVLSGTNVLQGSEVLMHPLNPLTYTASDCFHGTCETYDINTSSGIASTVDYVGWNSGRGQQSRNRLDLSPTGQPYLLYLDESEPSYLKFASPEQVPTEPKMTDVNAHAQFEMPSTQADSKGFPVIAVRSFATANHVTTGALRVMSNYGAQWIDEVVDSHGNTGINPDLYVDSTGRKYVSYFQDSDGNSTTGDLYFASNCGYSSSWITSRVDGQAWASTVGEYSALAVDAKGIVHILYFDQTNGALKHAYSDGTCRSNMQWQTELVDQGTNGPVGEYVDMVMDSSGVMNFSYYDAGNKHLKYGYGQSGSWTSFTLDATDDNGKYNSLIMDSKGDVMISYYSETDKTLQFITNKHPSTKFPPIYLGIPMGWYPMTVDKTAAVGMDTSIGLTHAGNPIISYYDDTNDDLKVALWDGQRWVLELKDGLYDSTGLMSSLFVDVLGGVHISYIDAVNKLFYLNF